MMTKIFYRGFILLNLLVTAQVYPQSNPGTNIENTDSLEVNDIVARVLKTYPSIKKAEEAINEAQENIDLTRTAYRPNINADASYSRIGPVPVFDIPNLGEFKLYPENNFDAHVAINENIYDFGKTASHTAFAEANKKMTETSLNLVRQTLALNTINVYYSLVYLQNAIAIRQEQLKNLNELVNFTKKKLNTGSSTNYELLNTRVRLSATESQITDLKSMKNSQLSVLSSLLDSALTVLSVKAESSNEESTDN